MKKLLLAIIFIAQIALAKDAPPSLGSCSPYLDYYIYKCQAYKCSLNVPKLVRTKLEMEILGEKDGVCLYNYKYIVRNPQIPPAEIKMQCKLSERGKLEMANQFTKFKKGDIGIYINPPVNQVLNSECDVY